PTSSKMEKFIFDVIVTHFELNPRLSVRDVSKLEVTVRFFGNSITMTKSRINVDEFKNNAGLEFNASIKKLRKNLEECGLQVEAKYDNRVLGMGTMSLPQKLIDSIDPNMSDALHTASTTIDKDGEVQGTVEIFFRLVIKCDEPKMGDDKICRTNMESSIPQQDIMFLVSGSQRCPNPCDPCVDILEQEEGDEQLQLDLSRYKSGSNALKAAAELTHTPAGNAACCEIKKMALECEKIVDSITKASGQPKPLKAPCRRAPEPSCNVDDFDYFPTIENPLTSPNVPCFSYMPARQGESPDFCSPSLMPVPISDLAKPMIKPIRFCPVCLTDMSWMPKFAACTTCGVKPMPVVEERHKEKKLTGDDIIKEFVGKSQNKSLDYYCEDPCKPKEEDSEDQRCYCTCKFGKLCAHCRIRKSLEDIFRADRNTRVCPKVKPQASEDFCVQENDPTECRPYLARVFSELRDLYNLKDTKRPTDVDSQSTIGSASRLRNQSPTEPRLKTAPKAKPVARKHKAVERIRKKFEAGHKDCVQTKNPVSRRQGWAWHLGKEATDHGWRPGFVRKSVKKIMKFFQDSSAFAICKKLKEEEATRMRRLPTLNLRKKEGVIYVTLRPLHDRNIQMHPIEFTIMKSDLAVAISDIKAKLKAKGFSKCTCHQPVMLCTCRHILDKKHLEYVLHKECKRRGMESCVDKLVLTDTSDSEMEFDFDVHPPASGDPCRWPPSRDVNNVNNGTQYNKKDLEVPPKWPTKVDPYWRAYDCAAGDRYTGTAFGVPGEEVFEDGIFGFGGGGPHGQSAAPGGRGKSAGVWGRGGGGPMRGGGRAGGGPRGGRGGAGGAGGPGGAGGAQSGPFGAGGPFGPGSKNFPGTKPKPGEIQKSPPIPVRMPERYYKAVKKAEEAKKEALELEEKKKKQGTNLIDYLEKKGTVPKPWNPNEPKTKEEKEEEKRHKGPIVGADGLTDAQRRRRDLLSGPVPPLDAMPRLGRGYDPCANPCNYACQPCYN
ncbi:hypothetical protein KR222_003483, partial [Zaprionus bogoriensis]